jgi:hypothetical protein
MLLGASLRPTNSPTGEEPHCSGLDEPSMDEQHSLKLPLGLSIKNHNVSFYRAGGRIATVTLLYAEVRKCVA